MRFPNKTTVLLTVCATLVYLHQPIPEKTKEITFNTFTSNILMLYKRHLITTIALSIWQFLLCQNSPSRFNAFCHAPSIQYTLSIMLIIKLLKILVILGDSDYATSLWLFSDWPFTIGINFVIWKRFDNVSFFSINFINLIRIFFLSRFLLFSRFPFST